MSKVEFQDRYLPRIERTFDAVTDSDSRDFGAQRMNANPSRLQRVTIALLCLFVGSQAVQAGVIFNLTDTGGAGIGTQARAGFEAAAAFWSSKFSDNVFVNLNIGFTTLGPNILGSASSTQQLNSYTDFRNAIAADMTSFHDATFSGSLPGGASFDPYINRTSDNPNGFGSATPYVDADGGANNTQVRINTATAKALGLLSANAAASDASITFSDAFTFDFDPSDGITAGAFDFVGVAIHEIGHALGFVSGVDILDINSPPVNGPFLDNQFTFVSPLDFTRFSIDSETAGADIDWTADARAKYFSIDGGATIFQNNAFSTGFYFGDGHQASHWKDDMGFGIMDPTLAPGELGVPSELDFIALDVIGWDRMSISAVPEPSSTALMSLIALAFVRRSRRQRDDPSANAEAT
ncbi:MAG: NF038122 family metalloprotease [Planctomycetaceae bacterium]